jgi:hypothetical protein
VKQLWRGDVGPLMHRMERQIDRAEDHLQHEGGMSRSRARDLAVIAGIALTMLGVKALKVLPSIPFAPGHKLVILTPFYVLASRLTRTRYGSTAAGLTMGSVAFLLGDGRYGIFEIVKHVTPGILCDLFVPILCRKGRRPGALAWSAFGGFLAVGRFATVFCVTLLVQPPAVAYAILIPGLTAYVIAGVLSGYVTYHLVGAAQQYADTHADHEEDAA